MNDTPSLSEAIEMASGSLQSSDETTGEQTQPETTPEPSEEVVQEAPQEESGEVQEEKTPLDEFDPNKLPEELKPLYQNLMKGFTQGRQKDREEVNTLKQQLEQLQAQLSPAISENRGPISPDEYVRQIAEQTLVNSKLEAYRNQALEDYNGLDPRLDKSNEETYDPILDTFVSNKLDEALTQYVAENGNELGFDYKNLAKEYLTNWDEYIKKQQDSYLSRQREIAKQAERKTGKLNPRGSSTSTQPSGSMSLEQAMEAARAKLNY